MSERRRTWSVIGSLWLATTLFVAYEIVPASVLPLVRSGLGIGPTAASWLVSAFLLGMAAFSLPSGILLDRFDERRAILTATVVLLASTAWAWWAATNGDYRSLLVARFIGGTAEVALWTAAVNVVGAIVDDTRRGTAIAVLATSVPGGFALGHLTGPTLAGYVGWAGLFLLYTGLGTVVVLGFFAMTRTVDVTIGAPKPTMAELSAVLQNRTVWLVGGLAFVAFSLNLLFNSWLPSYLADRFALSLVGGGAIAAAFPAIGMVARVVGGIGSDQYFGGRRTPLVLGSYLVIIPIIPLIAVVESVPWVFAGLVVAGFAMQLGLVLLIPLVRELVASNVAATALAILNTVGFLGAFSAPIVAASLISWFGFWAAFAYATALAGIGTGLVWFVPNRR